MPDKLIKPRLQFDKDKQKAKLQVQNTTSTIPPNL